MARPLRLSSKEMQNFLLGGVTVGAAFSAYKQVTDPLTIMLFVFFGLIALSLREFGQRTVAHWMEAEVDLELSEGGVATTIFVAMFSYVSTFSLVFLTPLFSTFSAESYEQWGKDIDVIWAKRMYWLASSGITFLLVGWILAYSLGISNLAELISLYTFFQLLPLDEEKKISGRLDGHYIILWTGFMWLIFLGLTIIAMILSAL